jgi:hypothetical protein
MIDVENIQGLQRIIDRVKKIQENIPLAMDVAAETITANVKQRIQVNGAATNGSILYTRSRETLGAYSQQHGSARVWDGLQINHVDLTYTGALMKSFKKLNQSVESTSIGFDDNEQSIKAVKMEKLYRTQIFDASEKEKQIGIDEYKKTLFK